MEAVERGSLFTASEVSSLLDTALPGMAEMGALLAIHDALASGKYASVVVDTAPFGHTLQLFRLPEQFSKLLDFLELAAERDQALAQHFGGRALPARGEEFINEWRGRLQRIKLAFASARLFLVTTAEEFALNESLRCIDQIQHADPPIKLSGIVLNRIVRRPGRCSLCKARAGAAKQAQRRLRKAYPGANLYLAEDPGFPLLGVRLLKQLGDAVFGREAVKLRPPSSPTADLNLIAREMTAAEWPALSSPLTFVVGKGGVGKTTISAALGFRSRQKSRAAVEICSVDPAPSLDDVFRTEVTDEPRPVLGDSGFCASELDSVALYKSWVAEMRSEIDSATSVRQSGVQIDLAYEKQLFSQLLDIVPPGLDEVLAIFRIVELLQTDTRKLVIDMAPTGHALELLRTPERILAWSRLLLKSLASHRKLTLAREAAVKIAELEVRARELSRSLKGSGVAVYGVMLAEPLPDRETERLLHELGKLHMSPEALFVNRVLSPDEAEKCARCRSTAASQARLLSGLKQRLSVKSVYVIPAFEHGPAGRRGLREITGKLWRFS